MTELDNLNIVLDKLGTAPIEKSGVIPLTNPRFREMAGGIFDNESIKEQKLLGAVRFNGGNNVSLITVDAQSQLQIHNVETSKIPSDVLEVVNESERTNKLDDFNELNFYQVSSSSVEVNTDTAGIEPEITFFSNDLSDPYADKTLTIGERQLIDTLTSNGQNGGLLHFRGEGQPAEIGILLERTEKDKKIGQVLLFYPNIPNSTDKPSFSNKSGVILEYFLNNLNKQWLERILRNGAYKDHSQDAQTLKYAQLETTSELSAQLFRSVLLANMLNGSEQSYSTIKSILRKGIFQKPVKSIDQATIENTLKSIENSSVVKEIATRNLITNYAKTLREAIAEDNHFGEATDLTISYVIKISDFANKYLENNHDKINNLTDSISLLNELLQTKFAGERVHANVSSGSITSLRLHGFDHCKMSQGYLICDDKDLRSAKSMLEMTISQLSQKRFNLETQAN